MNVIPLPPSPIVTNSGDTLFSNSPIGNQWYFEGILIMGATSQTYVPTQNGYYWDVVMNNGCISDTSNHIQIILEGINMHPFCAINVYPVPNSGRFNLIMTAASDEIFTVNVYNSLGAKIKEEEKIYVYGLKQKLIDLGPVPNGLYTLIIENSQSQMVKKIVVHK